nr:hypothetical protein [Sedimentibacter sp.]
MEHYGSEPFRDIWCLDCRGVGYHVAALMVTKKYGYINRKKEAPVSDSPERHSSIGKLVEPYPKPIRNSIREALSQ